VEILKNSKTKKNKIKLKCLRNEVGY
jgi:hypothetical protein